MKTGKCGICDLDLDIAYWLLAISFWLLAVSYWLLVFGY